MGHNRVRGERAIRLPADLTYAFIPGTSHSIRLARMANREGKEVMLHLPMANTHNQPLGDFALTTDLSRQDFSQTFEAAMNRVPFASGINNHMGSALTQQPMAMQWLMQSVKKHRLFFVDSRTTPLTVASEIAQQANIRTASRDVFLDNVRTSYEIDRQFRRLLSKAERNRTAIAIGHPYEATIDYLEAVIPILAAENIRIVPVSEIIKMRLASQQLAATAAAE